MRFIIRRNMIIAISALLAALFPFPWAAAADSVPELIFSQSGHSLFGDWQAEIKVSSGDWHPGKKIRADVSLGLPRALLANMEDRLSIKAKNIIMLVTSERCFDAGGRLRLPSDEFMSTLLTPTELAIEGGSTGAISRTTGSRYRNPVDRLVKLPVTSLTASGDSLRGAFSTEFTLPDNIPPGIYRLRFDFGVSDKRYYSLNGESFAGRQREAENLSLAYSPPVPCSGRNVNGETISAKDIKPRIYWVVFSQYNSNGSRGAVAEEDSGNFALSNRNIIPDEVILPLYNDGGKVTSYSLEPAFYADTVDKQRNIPWDPNSGELSIKITDPSGNTTDLGASPFKGVKGQWLTTGNQKFTAWKPGGYGLYKAEITGWAADKWGNRYHGGGTYRFWIAKRLTMATATFQGMAYPVGSMYGKDMAFNPPVPADVTVKVDLYPDSDPSRVKTLTYGGKASAAGVFGAAQGMKPFPLDAPGEYHAHVLATYTDSGGNLWVSSMRHAGVVYPQDTPLVAHGKKIKINNQLAERGESNTEGYYDPGNDIRSLEHINFPYNAGDAILIAAEGHGANKIEPVLTYEIKGSKDSYDPGLQGIGSTNLRIKTSNGMSPHLYPEYITDWAYYYSAAPRPGFSSRFLVGEDGVRAPYWPTSATNFGGQIGASKNGDQPGDIYRLLGGVVLRKQSETPLYAGYIASAFILPGGTKNNRIIAPGSEDLTGADGGRARFFLVPVRPGMVYDLGSTFVPFLQIDPIVPAKVRFTLRYPDGREVVSEGTGDNFGYFIGRDRWKLDQPGVYTYNAKTEWDGHPGRVPGLPDEGGYIFVKDNSQLSQAPGLQLLLKSQQPFQAAGGLLIKGRSTAGQVYYAAITPGAVIDQGKIPVINGEFSYMFDPEAINKKIPIYDIQNLRSGLKEIGRIVHLTFFAVEKSPGGTECQSFARVIFRGATAIYVQ